jgi:tRNA (cmo5U34)-methyltransferase
MTPPIKSDNIYAKARQAVADFSFSDKVVAVFPDMIARSVPGYDNVIATTGLLAAEHLPEGGKIFDLGCSLGATSYATLAYLKDPTAQMVGVDSSEPMIREAKRQQRDARLTFVHGDILDQDFSGTNVVMLNYVLQFIDPEHRLALLTRIREQMAPDGMLLLSEKIRSSNPNHQAQMEQAHWAFKRANGYSELEVSQKRSALENVMIVDTEAEHRRRLAAAGFTKTTRWFQCLNWASFIIHP